MIRSPSITNPVPETSCGGIFVHGRRKSGARYDAKIFATESRHLLWAGASAPGSLHKNTNSTHGRRRRIAILSFGGAGTHPRTGPRYDPPMGSTLTIRAPERYDLARDVCSYGYFLLAPNHWDTRRRRLLRVLALADGPALASITQPLAGILRARFDRRLSRPEQHTARARIVRMTAVDTSDDEVRAFHRVDPRWKKSGRARLFRSPPSSRTSSRPSPAATSPGPAPST